MKKRSRSYLVSGGIGHLRFRITKTWRLGSSCFPHTARFSDWAVVYRAWHLGPFELRYYTPLRRGTP